MVNDRDILAQWRGLFKGQKVTSDILAKAEVLLEGLGSESPLRFRLAQELEDIRKLPTKRKP